jgi:hypothetical protein
MRHGVNATAICGRLRWVSALLLVLLSLAATHGYAQTSPPRLQVFLVIEGTVPDWVRADLTVSKLQVGGIDPVTGDQLHLSR